MNESTREAGDAELVEAMRAGDADAFDELFARSSRRLLLFVRLRLRGAVAARLEPTDVLQEVYLKASELKGRFVSGDGRGFARWLCRIAENGLRDAEDFYAAAKRRPPGAVQRVSRLVERLDLSGTGPATRAARDDEVAALGAAIEELDADLREVVLLSYFEERSQEEIAERMGRSASAVRRLLAKATARLAARMGGPPTA